MKRAISLVLQVSLLVGFTTVVIGTVPAHAVGLSTCSNTGTLAGNDDGSTGQVPLGYQLNFFGQDYSNVYINNNGNVTFTGANGDFTPAPLVGQSTPIIAPFWADVDTRPVGSAEVTYGTTTFDTHAAFCVNWDGVGYYDEHTSPLNHFQLLLVDRSDVNPGDFDIVFNYDSIGWDTSDSSGAARAGYSDGVSQSFEVTGSGTAGAFVDGNVSTGLIHNSTSGAPDGQFVFPVRNGAPQTAPSITSPDNATFTEGVEGSFTVTTTGNPTPSIGFGENQQLPDGVGLADNGDGTATLSGTPDSGTAGPYPLDLVAQNGVDPNAEQAFTLTVDPSENSPNLTLTKTASPDPVAELNPITYSLDVGNNGAADANDVTVTDHLPAGTTFDSASTTQGSCTHAGTTVTCALGTLAHSSEGTETITITAQAPNVTANTTITNTASVSASNADTASASVDSHVLVNQGGSEQGEVPPGTTVPLTFTTSTQSTNGNPGVNGTDPTSVSLIVPPGGPGGSLTLEELPCAHAPCDGPAAQTNAATATTAKLVLGGVVFNVVPPPGYPRSKPFKATLLYDKTLHAKAGPVYYFKQGVTPQEITLPHCGTMPPNGGKPCVLFNAQLTTGSSLVKGDWKVTVRLSSDPHMRR